MLICRVLPVSLPQTQTFVVPLLTTRRTAHAADAPAASCPRGDALLSRRPLRVPLCAHIILVSVFFFSPLVTMGTAFASLFPHYELCRSNLIRLTFYT